MNRLLFLLPCLAVWLAFVSFNIGSSPEEFVGSGKRPNIILILTDDQGYGDLGCTGNPWLKTPHLDELYRKSIRLTNYHTGTTCSPTRASLMTGQYCNRVGVWHTIGGRSLLEPGVPTLADLLSRQGYRTALFGKWHLGDNYPLRPQDRGFQEVLTHGGGGVGQTPDYWGNDYFDDTYLHNGRPQTYKGYCTDVWVDEAIRFIDQNRQRRQTDPPFFCYLSLNAPHAPYHVPEEYRKLYANNPAIPNPAFYGMITHLDGAVGRLMKHLQAVGLSDNTMLIFTSDNGSAAGAVFDKEGKLTKGYNAGMRGLKASPLEGGHRVPFFIYFPARRLNEGRDVPQLTASIDVLPTLLDLCGLPPPKSARLDGMSLTPLLLNKPDRWPDRIVVTDTQREDTLRKNKAYAVMTNRWRLVNGRELYDIAKDPGQQQNVAAAYPDTLKRLLRAYDAWWADVSRHQNAPVRLVVGGSENPVRLTCHDLHPDGDAFPAWNQIFVRQGDMPSLGTWSLRVHQPGRYQISLRRWPVESGLANDATAPAGDPVPGGESYPPGRAFVWQQAYLTVGGKPYQQPIDHTKPFPVFNVDLPAGPVDLRAWFADAGGRQTGAYYVEVTRR